MLGTRCSSALRSRCLRSRSPHPRTARRTSPGGRRRRGSRGTLPRAPAARPPTRRGDAPRWRGARQSQRGKALFVGGSAQTDHLPQERERRDADQQQREHVAAPETVFRDKALCSASDEEPPQAGPRSVRPAGGRTRARCRRRSGPHADHLRFGGTSRPAGPRRRARRSTSPRHLDRTVAQEDLAVRACRHPVVVGDHHQRGAGVPNGAEAVPAPARRPRCPARPSARPRRPPSARSPVRGRPPPAGPRHRTARPGPGRRGRRPRAAPATRATVQPSHGRASRARAAGRRSGPPSARARAGRTAARCPSRDGAAGSGPPPQGHRGADRRRQPRLPAGGSRRGTAAAWTSRCPTGR